MCFSVQREQADAVDEGMFEQRHEQGVYDRPRVSGRARLQRDAPSSAACQPTAATARSTQDLQGEFFLAEITHFNAEFSLVLKRIQSIGECKGSCQLPL